MIHIFANYGGTLLYGLGQTLLCSLIALVFSPIIGTLFALLEESESKVARGIARVYIEIFRNIPLLVITMFFYVVIPLYIVKVNGFTAGTIGLDALHLGLYCRNGAGGGSSPSTLARWKGLGPMGWTF